VVNRFGLSGAVRGPGKRVTVDQALWMEEPHIEVHAGIVDECVGDGRPPFGISYWLRVFPTEETYLQALVIANLLLLPPDPV